MADSWRLPGTFPSNKHGYKHIDKKHIYIYIHRYINTYVFFVAVPLFWKCVVSFLPCFFSPRIPEALRRHFGFAALKQFQVAAIGAWAEGKDVPLGFMANQPNPPGLT